MREAICKEIKIVFEIIKDKKVLKY